MDWDLVAAPTRRWLENYLVELKQDLPLLRFKAGSYPSENYPLRVNSSLGAAGDPLIEDLAMGFRVRRADSGLVFSCDVDQGEVDFFAFGPETRVAEGSDVAPWVLRSIADGMDFLVSQRQNVIKALRTALER